jgi:hypothetical protein
MLSYISTIALIRDGVSEGQFRQVLLYELNAIQKVHFDMIRNCLCADLDACH